MATSTLGGPGGMFDANITQHRGSNMNRAQGGKQRWVRGDVRGNITQHRASNVNLAQGGKQRWARWDV